MTNPNQSPTKTSLHEQIEQISALLNSLRPRLVEAEAELSDRLAAISRPLIPGSFSSSQGVVGF